MDVARGLIILGVVLNHAVDGLTRSGALHPDGLLAQVNAALYVFRMPALVFVVGLFVPGGVRKHGARGYLVRRTTLLLYLLVVWQVVQGAVEILSQDHRNGSTRPLDILTLWKPLAHLWFLPFLAVGTAVCVTLSAWTRPWWLRTLLLLALVGLSVTTWGWDVRYFGSNGSGLLTFLVAGSTIGLQRLGHLSTAPVVPVAAGLGAVTAAFTFLLHTARLAPATQPEELSTGDRALSVVAATTGVAGVLLLATLLARSAIASRLLSYVGSRTLAIYLGHVIVVAGCRVVLVGFGAGPATILVVAVPVAVLTCLGLSALSSWAPFRWLLHLPRSRRRRLGAGHRKARRGAATASPESPGVHPGPSVTTRGTHRDVPAPTTGGPSEPRVPGTEP